METHPFKYIHLAQSSGGLLPRCRGENALLRGSIDTDSCEPMIDSMENPFRDLLHRGSVCSVTLGGSGTGRNVAGGGRGRDSNGVGGR